ncbi:MAG: RluA family pseudouridine synthase [Planctomycetota bacterium]
MSNIETFQSESLLIPDEICFEVDPADQGHRTDSFLTQRMRWRSRTSIQKLVQEGKIFVSRNGKRCEVKKSSATVLQGDTIHVTLPKPKRDIEFEANSGANAPGLPVLFEDRYLVAVDKPPNVPVHPAGRNLYRTVITSLHLKYRRTGDPEQDIVPKLCHRLDLETSGVLLVAKDDTAHRRMSEQFRERLPEKEYLAIIHGVPDPAQGLIDLPIGPAMGRQVNLARAVRHDVGQPSRTIYEVESVHGAFALLRIRLLTGRHHQIRVHMDAIGHHLVGDKIYGVDEELFVKYYDDALTEEDQARLLLPRQALHAHRLSFKHPMTEEPTEIIAPLPADLSAFLSRMGGDET